MSEDLSLSVIPYKAISLYDVIPLITRSRRYIINCERYIDREIGEYLANTINNIPLLMEGNLISEEILSVLAKFNKEKEKNLNPRIGDFREYEEKLMDIYIEVQKTHRVMQMDQFLKIFEEVADREELQNAMNCLNNIKILMNIPGDIWKMTYLENIRRTYYTYSNVLEDKLKKKFTEVLELEQYEINDMHCVSLKVMKDNAKMTDILKPLFNSGYNGFDFGKLLMKYVFEPLVANKVKHVLKVTNANIQLIISYSNRKNQTSPLLKSNYKIILDNIKTVFTCLQFANIPLDSTSTVMTVIFKYIKKEFLNLLVNKCLRIGLPKSVKEKRQSTLIHDAQNIYNLLINMNIINKGTDSQLLMFVHDYEIIFKNHLVKNVLSDIRTILKQNIQDIALAPELIDFETWNSVIYTTRLKLIVSRHIVEIINIINVVMSDTFQKEEEKVEQLLLISNIIQSYIHEAPKFHKEIITVNAKANAIFYNNCLYLSNYILTCYKKCVPGFVSLGISLRLLARNCFLTYYKSQILKLEEIFNKFDISYGGCSVIIEYTDHINLLKKNWYQIWCDGFAEDEIFSLFNSLPCKILNKIMEMKAITEVELKQLIKIIETVEKNGSDIISMDDNYAHLRLLRKLITLKKNLILKLYGNFDKNQIVNEPSLRSDFKSDEIDHLISILYAISD